MKIGDSDNLQPVTPSAPATTSPTTKSDQAATGIQDKSTTSISAVVSSVRQQVADSQVSRVSQLADQVSKGTYVPSAEEIASEIFAEAMLDAELAAGG